MRQPDGARHWSATISALERGISLGVAIDGAGAVELGWFSIVNARNGWAASDAPPQGFTIATANAATMIATAAGFRADPPPTRTSVGRAPRSSASGAGTLLGRP